jgi:hypothetical protein
VTVAIGRIVDFTRGSALSRIAARNHSETWWASSSVGIARNSARSCRSAPAPHADERSACSGYFLLTIVAASLKDSLNVGKPHRMMTASLTRSGQFRLSRGILLQISAALDRSMITRSTCAARMS